MRSKLPPDERSELPSMPALNEGYRTHLQLCFIVPLTLDNTMYCWYI
jgi:hypothetical protein